ncbi:MAG: hypothetical protein ACKVPY_01135 [Paracoccaceae bacterium]
MDFTEADPKGLVREAYAIEGITPSECRSIFLDWALSLKAGVDARGAMLALLEGYAARADHDTHPMTAVIRDGLAAPEHPVRRGGRAARVAGKTGD